LNADDILDKMDADKDGCIDKEEWAKHMTPELKAAIEAKLQDSGLVSGFKPLVDIARVGTIINVKYVLFRSIA
jgi:hypothetical protein